MQKRFIFLFIATILLTLFVLYSCNEPNVVENKKIEKQEKPVLKKGTAKDNNSVTDVTATGKLLGYKVVKENGKEVKVPVYDKDTTNNITPERFFAGYGSYWYIYYWEFDHYEPVSGSVLGIRPYDTSQDLYNRLKNKWGFTGIYIGTNNYQMAINAGFNFKFMMLPVTPDNYKSIIGNVHSLATTYYSDEPFHRNCPGKAWVHAEWEGKLYMLSIIRDYAHAHGAKYAISHYFACTHVVEYSSDVDLLMYDGYTDNEPYGDCFIPEGEDQRNALTGWLNLFGNKASRFWVGTGITKGNSDNDDNEFGQLFG